MNRELLEALYEAHNDALSRLRYERDQTEASGSQSRRHSAEELFEQFSYRISIIIELYWKAHGPKPDSEIRP